MILDSYWPPVAFIVGLPNDRKLHSCVYLDGNSNYAWKDTEDCAQPFSYVCEFCKCKLLSFGHNHKFLN